MNDAERLKEVQELKKVSRSLKKLPKLLERYSTLVFRLTWLLRQERIPRWMFPYIDPMTVNIVDEVLSAIETKISDRGNLFSHRSTSADSEL